MRWFIDSGLEKWQYMEMRRHQRAEIPNFGRSGNEGVDVIAQRFNDEGNSNMEKIQIVEVKPACY